MYLTKVMKWGVHYRLGQIYRLNLDLTWIIYQSMFISARYKHVQGMRP